jgi:hypothetical protein
MSYIIQWGNGDAWNLDLYYEGCFIKRIRTDRQHTEQELREICDKWAKMVDTELENAILYGIDSNEKEV